MTSSVSEEINRRLALVVDDEPASRLILTALLNKYEFEVVQATNGEEAISAFLEHHPSIIFMDVYMPVMDGYEAATQIKQQMQEEFVPIIFITAATDEESLHSCVDAGGDDFLTKPYSDTILLSKIRALERIRALMAQTAELKNKMLSEEELAEKIFTGAVTTPNAISNNLRTVQLPAGLFSGDIILCSFTPANDLDILIGDFTGHGLTAAVGALPTSEIFHAMSVKGFSGIEILEAVNEKLNRILPTGMFMALQFVRVSHEMDHVKVCNAGMPDILILDGATGKIKQRAASRSLPLGVMAKLDFKPSIQILPITHGDRIVMFSDGVIESRNQAGEEFSQTRLETLLQDTRGTPFAVDHAFTSIKEHNQNVEQDDDISLLEVICSPDLLPLWDETQVANDLPTQSISCDPVSLSIIYQNERLRDNDPIPAIINFLRSNPILEEHRQALFTIFTELYVNALDHGVLGLKSELKKTPEGFGQYFIQREERLAALSQGFIRIGLEVIPNDSDGSSITVRIEDSGQGFDVQKYTTSANEGNESALSGRGIRLVKELCHSVNYLGCGNIVEAVFRWDN